MVGDLYVDALRTVARASIPAVVIRNEDVRADPAGVLAAIGSLVGQTPPPSVRPAEPTHSLGGNLWVQLGYEARTEQAFDTFGIPHRSGGHSEAQWDQIAARSSISAAHRPDSPTAALGLIQAVADAPGLYDTAQLLGYEMAREMSAFEASLG
jgi:hypothetical protein